MLKIKNVFSMFFFSVLLVGCTEEIDYRQIKNIQGLIYKVNEKDPFSGRVLNYPINSIGIASSAVCKADIKNGMPDGAMECTRDNIVIYTGEYTVGKRDGAEHVFSETGSKISSSNWKGGVKNGIERKYNKENELLISEITYLNGKKDGVEKAWTKDGKTEITNLVWKDGKATGFQVGGYGDQNNYLDGKYHGLIKRVGFFKGNQVFLKSETNYKSGKREGIETVYIAPDKIQKTNTYKDDKLMQGKNYEYASHGEGDVIGEYSILRVNNVIENKDPDNDYETILVYDGQQSGTDEAGNFSYDVKWDKGVLVSADAYKIINGSKVLVYKGVGRPVYNHRYSDNDEIFIEALEKDGVENVFHGDEFVGQVVWNVGEIVSFAIKYNSLYLDEKDSNDFIISKPSSKYVNHTAKNFMIPTELLVISDRYITLDPNDNLGVEKFDSYEESILDKETFKAFKEAEEQKKNRMVY